MPAARPVAERFDLYVERTESCWLWTGQLDAKGYGRISAGSPRRKVLAHRVAYELFIGPIPDGLPLDHLCRIRRCVNPRHLEPVTQLENMRRTRRTHCRQGHPLTPENTLHSLGHRRCRRCNVTSSRERRTHLPCGIRR